MTLVQVDSNICSLSNNTDKEYVAHAGASPDIYSQYKKILRFIIFFVDTQYIYFSSVSPYPSSLFLSFNNNYPSQAPLSPWGQRTDRNLKKRLNDAKKGNQATFLTPPSPSRSTKPLGLPCDTQKRKGYSIFSQK